MQDNCRTVIEQDDTYTFRTIQREDLQELRALQLELFPVKYTRQFYLSLLDSTSTWTVVALETSTNKIIGVCSARVFEENQYYWCGLQRNKIRMGYIMTLGVSTLHRRKGLASKMLDMLEQRMLLEPYNVTRLTLHCKVDNHQALSFYKTFGFYKAKKIKNYYDFSGRYEDAYQLVRDAIVIDTDNSTLIVDAPDDDEEIDTRLYQQIPMLQTIVNYFLSVTSHITRCTFYVLDYCRNAWTPGNNRYYHTHWSDLLSSLRRFMTIDSKQSYQPVIDEEDEDMKRTVSWSVTTAKKRFFLNDSYEESVTIN
jgi:ribosomal protein S18 acetylase RimI-like enzyme